MVVSNPAGGLFPEFSLPDLFGEKVDLVNYSGKRLIIFMWASW